MSSLNIDETYTGGGAFLKASDLGMRRANLTVKGARLEKMKDDQQKIVLDFVETDKTLVLNRTNANMIAELLGNRDASQWAGSAITLRPDKTTDPSGKPVDCIRVDFELPPQTNPNSLGAFQVAKNPALGQTAAQVAQAAPVFNSQPVNNQQPINNQVAPNLSAPDLNQQAPAVPVNAADIPF